MNKTDQLEALRANLRTLIRNSGKTLQDIIDQTGIPRATLYQRLNQEGSSIYIHEVHKIWTACGKPGKYVGSIEVTHSSAENNRMLKTVGS